MSLWTENSSTAYERISLESNGDVLFGTTVTKISGSATSTGSFGKLLGDGSSLTNLPASDPFPFTGSANISGSLTVAGQGGTVFQATSELTGSLFSVSTPAGLGGLEVFDDGRVVGRFERPIKRHTTDFSASIANAGQSVSYTHLRAHET